MNPNTHSTQLPEALLSIADKIKLSDLLDCPFTQADAISMVTHITKHSYLHHESMEPDDEKLELNLQRINMAIPGESRHIAFTVVRERHQQSKL